MEGIETADVEEYDPANEAIQDTEDNLMKGKPEKQP